MKAFQLMVFMMLFNFSVFMISSFYIYNIEAGDEWQHAEEFDLSSDEYQPTSSGIGGFAGVPFLGTALIGIFSALATATVISFIPGTSGKSADGVIYALFGGTYFAVTATSYFTFRDILPTHITPVSYLLNIYIVMLVILFVMGIVQLVRGGMDHYI